MPNPQLDFFEIGTWISEKLKYHKKSGDRRVERMQVNQGEIWECDLGYNIGQEKNKRRPVVVLSNNGVNQTGKVLIAPITDAEDHLNKFYMPIHNTWYLLYSATMGKSNTTVPNRKVPKNAHVYKCLSKDSIIQCEEMRSVSKARLSKLPVNESLSKNDLTYIKKKLKNVFDIK